MRLLFFVVAVVVSTLVHAGSDRQFQKLSGTIPVGAVLDVSGNRYSTSQLIPVGNRSYWTEKSFGLVKLSYPGPATNWPTGQATVMVSIQYQVEENGIFITKSATPSLTLNFGTALATDVAYFKAAGAQNIHVSILAGTTIPSGWSGIELEASIETESFDLLEKNAVTNISLTHQIALTLDGNLKLNWTALTGAEFYELEWTYVSDQDGTDPALRLSPENIEVDRFLFRGNSSRVTVTGLTYEVPMIYERGIILYRLRAAGKNVVNSVPVPAATEWTAPDGRYGTVAEYPVANRYTFNGLEEDMNWQSSLSFAEEGKNKVVLSYHDGSARNRQAVTRINSDQRAIVGETFYDYNGRPVIQALPVPVVENNITFYPNFNLVEGKAQMDKADYDQAVEGSGCEPISPPFATSTGASQYYSSDNNFDDNGNTGNHLLNRDLIPNANKFPYTQTQYTPDNTGRIASQSGVGLTHRLGTGKETRYLYGSPFQPELTRLFGSQVGYAAHYKKNTVVDPNGQTSVSYLDLDGKVVATALAGESPANVTSLDGPKARTIKADLLATGPMVNQLSIDGLSKVYSKKFTVTGANTTYKFLYNGAFGKYDLTCSRSQSSAPINYSLDGAVDVELILQDKCGTPIFTENEFTLKGNTAAVQTVEIPQEKLLQPGEYLLTKTVKINEEKLEAYWQEYLAQEGTCVLTDNTFKDSELDSIDVSGCGITCSQCEIERDRILASTTTLSTEEREILLSVCDDVCLDEAITCRAGLEAMRGDMSPGGQYGQLRKEKLNQPTSPTASLDENNQPQVSSLDITFNKADGAYDAGDPADNVIDASGFPVSIFNVQNRLRLPNLLQGQGLQANWKYPVQINKSGFPAALNLSNEVLYRNDMNLKDGVTYSLTNYKDKDGSIFYVNVFKITRDDLSVYYLPAVSDVNELVLVDEESQLYKIPVRFLSELADFEKYWKGNWANYLIPYHPEYEYLVECTNEQESHAFDYSLVNANTVALAIEAGFLDNNGNPTIIRADQSSSMDPFVRTSNPYYVFMKDKTDNYKSMEVNGTTAMRSMAEMVTITVGCPRGQTNCGIPGCLDGIINTEEEWSAYRAFYLAEKQKLMRNKALRTAVDGLYYNGCIGHKDYLTNPEASYFRRPIEHLVAFTGTYRDCWKAWYDLFNWNEVCVDRPFTSYHNATTYPYLNPAQLCYINRAPDYEKKTQRFYPQVVSSVGGGQVAQNCVTYLNNEDPLLDPIEISIPCDQDIARSMDLAIADAQRFKYESCGQCPMASDVELLLMDLKSNNLLSPVDPLLLSCDLEQYPVKLGEVLRREFLPANALNPEVFWTSTLSLGDKLLTGRFFSGATEFATLSLRIPDDVPATFLTMGSLCCLSVLKSATSTYFIYQPGKVFKMKSSINGVDFMLEGETSISLDPCTIAPRCLITDDVTSVGFFLNVLSIDASFLTDKVHNLNTNDATLALTQGTLADYYTNPVRSLLRKDNKDVANGYIEDVSPLNPTWRSSVNGSTLSGVLAYTLNSNNYQVLIEISGLPAGYEYSQIEEFVGLRPEAIDMNSNDPCREQPCERQTFLADVLIVNGIQRQVFTVTVHVPSLKPIICKPALPPNTNN